ncbi:exodeoxyribonuclease VII large subunit [Coraliomargarita sp. SDUM461004]|uniref:Exodeoxyribonuclease 7 large subunit n=1 Tax=Thalassobacterium sedimentorum TaxID=3041258 RepID=A0ABU1AIJ0_9BACT|nr:exodeoxyribonuclease VII large subunit [Coraliomargarita sp. SDUM461004]MDQ8194610.1 exodeoxyribonuclease VII large subunit [Coraliomargarita sp. SDUM461004]
MLNNRLTPSPEQILKVTALTRLIKGQLEENFARVWVKGEISNLRKQNSGHLYFSLKDSGSQLPCALFARDAARQSFDLKDGMEVLLHGDISVFEPHGRYQLIAKVAIQSGEGRLQLEFERLKRKLAAEGLFAAERKQPLPTLPKKIAVITSPTGAAVRDFLRILRRRHYLGEVVIFPAKVQGQGAAEEVASMLQYAGASNGFDLVVLTRGGGSIEDLWAFNEEILARAVANCPLPVISAIGHEIDTVLTDYAADKRAETPSGAAELISSLYLEAQARYEDAQQDLNAYIADALTHTHTQLRDLDARMRIIAPERSVQHLGMRLDDLENRLSQNLSRRIANEQQSLARCAQRITEQHPKTRLGIAAQHLSDYSRRLERATKFSLVQNKDRINALQHRLNNGSLQATMRRGFAVLQNTEGTLIDSAALARQESRLKASFHDGELHLKTEK